MTVPARRRLVSALRRLVVAVLLLIGGFAVLDQGAATAAPEPTPVEPIGPIVPIEPAAPTLPDRVERVGSPFEQVQVEQADGGDGSTLSIDVPGADDSSNIVVIILVLTVLSVAPSVLILMTSFTRIVIVLSLTRNALGIPQLPPQQVIVGLSIFMTLFVMGPTLEVLNNEALQPLLANEIEVGEALEIAEQPMREFMLESTRESELELFLDANDVETPVIRDEVPLTALIPAFVLSELKSAFIMGFVIMVPFLVIDIVVSAVLVSLGMMMLPPTFVSLPMKLLLFILLDGWSLVIEMLLNTS